MASLTVVRPIDPKTPGYFLSQRWGVVNGVPQLNGVGGHSGTDWACPRGTEIRACADALVLYAGPASGFGDHAVCLWHPQLEVTTTYGHGMDHVVAYLQQVTAGQVIGHVNSQGYSTGDHLHGEIRPHEVPWGGNPPNFDFEQWLVLHQAQAGAPMPGLTDQDRAYIKRMQYLLGVKQDGVWKQSTDNAYQTLRWKLLSPPRKPAVSSTVRAMQHDLFHFSAPQQDGIYGPKTDAAWQLCRLCWLNK